MGFFTLIPSGQTDNRRQAPKWTLFMEVNDRYIFISSSEAAQIHVGAPQYAGWWRNERVEAFLCTCVKAKQILESQLFPRVISDDHCYNLRFTAKQKEREKGKEKKKEKKKQTTKQALEKAPVNHTKQQEESRGKEWRHPGNNPGMKAESQTLAELWSRNFLYLSDSRILDTAVPPSWAGTLTHSSCQKRGKMGKVWGWALLKLQSPSLFSFCLVVGLAYHWRCAQKCHYPVINEYKIGTV